MTRASFVCLGLRGGLAGVATRLVAATGNSQRHIQSSEPHGLSRHWQDAHLSLHEESHVCPRNCGKDWRSARHREIRRKQRVS